MVGDIVKKEKSKKEKEKEDDHSRLEPEDKTVRELLTEMKDNSELIADLAYAALVYDNRDLAEEVGHLESRMDNMMYQIRLKSMLSARNIDDAERLSGLLQIASSAENISDAAEDMVELLDLDIDLKSMLPYILEKADEHIHTIRVLENSDLVGKRIGDLAIESVTGVRIVALRRKGRWLYGPDGDDIIQAKDRLIVRGIEEGYRKLRKVAKSKEDWRGVKS